MSSAGGTEMHIETLLGKMESLISEGRKVPLTGKVLVDPEELLDLIEDIRQALPEDFREAQRINAGREDILAHAREEGEQILRQAQSLAGRLTEETAIALEAQQKADRLIEESKEVAREIRVRAKEYADEVLEKIEGQMERLLETIHRNREELRR
ncbi:MAG: ATPase [Actinobacteria bacterium]|nr:ATPase [Actinomycetota bacterium]